MKRLLIFGAAIIVILAIAPHGSAFTITVINNVDTADCRYLPSYEMHYMAEVNFYYNAFGNVKAYTAFIPSGESYTYNSGNWCPSGVTGYMYSKKVQDGKEVSTQRFIILAADNWGRHNEGLNFACQNSTFKINCGKCFMENKCNNHDTFSFDRQ
jgi:hypothetical protein